MFPLEGFFLDAIGVGGGVIPDFEIVGETLGFTVVGVGIGVILGVGLEDKTAFEFGVESE